MVLAYQKEHILACDAVSACRSADGKTRPEKLSKPKIAALVVLNMAVWAIALGFYLEITPVSIQKSVSAYMKRRNLVVSGVVCNSKVQAAIIADSIYGVGDTVRGFTIIEITPQGVELFKDGQTTFKQVAPLP